MTDVYLYADETGDLDLTGAFGTSRYFGFGTAVFADRHGRQLWEGLRLRCHLEGRGVRLPRGFHAKNDSWPTRAEVFTLIGAQRPRFDTTFLLKESGTKAGIVGSPIDLYRIAWHLHLTAVVRMVSRPDDRLFVIVGTLQTHNKREAIRRAVEEVCDRVSGRLIVPCIWDAPSSWGIQVADYGLWATHRRIEGRESPWFDTCIGPTLRSVLTPWGGQAESRLSQ